MNVAREYYPMSHDKTLCLSTYGLYKSPPPGLCKPLTHGTETCNRFSIFVSTIILLLIVCLSNFCHHDRYNAKNVTVTTQFLDHQPVRIYNDIYIFNEAANFNIVQVQSS